MNQTSPAVPTKSHYEILDGLRGVAAITVVTFHCFEPYSLGDHTKQIINHGYLAVDFFFLLSGFVVAYAYDDRWGRMTEWEFYKRRLIRLQPMVIAGSVIGAILFYFAAGPEFRLISATPVWKVLLYMVIGATLLPVLPSMDIRGWDEMHPLNGPAWSLFFEYIANILYAAIVRKFSKRALAVLVFLAGVFLIHMAVTSKHGDVIGGWSLDPTELHVGFARLLYPFFAGVLLMRLGKRIHVEGAFAWCSLLLLAILAFPRVGGSLHLWVNGLFDSFSILILFPMVVAMGAGGRVTGKVETKAWKYLAEISYPLYITHYPLIYINTTWTAKQKFPVAAGFGWGAALLLVAVSVAYACLKLYDEPVRTWLGARFLVRGGKLSRAVRVSEAAR